MEIWKDIKNYENYYQISSYGNIRSLDRVVKTLKKDKLICGLNIKQNIDTNGYLSVRLSKNNIRNIFRVHRLVALVFLDENKDKPYVNHINGIKTDNRIENLEWVNSSENKIHAYNIGLINQKAEKNNNSKLSKLDIDKIKSNFILTPKGLSYKFNISRSMIYHILNNRNWVC